MSQLDISWTSSVYFGIGRHQRSGRRYSYRLQYFVGVLSILPRLPTQSDAGVTEQVLRETTGHDEVSGFIGRQSCSLAKWSPADGRLQLARGSSSDLDVFLTTDYHYHHTTSSSMLRAYHTSRHSIPLAEQFGGLTPPPGRASIETTESRMGSSPLLPLVVVHDYRTRLWQTMFIKELGISTSLWGDDVLFRPKQQ
jgi:hypothetical protein